jgi:hypothetical protein
LPIFASAGSETSPHTHAVAARVEKIRQSPAHNRAAFFIFFSFSAAATTDDTTKSSLFLRKQKTKYYFCY